MRHYTRGNKEQKQIETLERDIRKGEKWLIVLTGAMAFFALCGVVVGFLQWRTYSGQLNVMQGTLSEMKRSGGEATSEMWQAIGNLNWQAQSMDAVVKQSRAALAASIQATRRDQRAWIDVIGAKTIGGKANQIGFDFNTVTVIIQNSGKTPALNLERECCIITRRSFKEAIPDYDGEAQRCKANAIPEYPCLRNSGNQTANFAAGKGVWPPQTAYEETMIDGGFTLPFLIMRNGMETASIGYILGKITYNDIFPGTKRHTTTVCLMSKASASFVPCPSGTRMD